MKEITKQNISKKIMILIQNFKNKLKINNKIEE